MATARSILNDAIRAGRHIDRADDRRDRNNIRDSEASALLSAESKEQARDGNNVLDAQEMQRQIHAFAELPGRTSIIAGEQAGTYRFKYEDIVSDNDMRIAPDALALAAQSGRIRVNAPIPAFSPAPAPAPITEADLRANGELAPNRPANATPMGPAADAPQAPSQAVYTPSTIVETAAATAAAPTINLTAPAGAKASLYRVESGPEGLHQNQVRDVQQLLLDAGMDVGGNGRTPDEKWGPRSQAAFTQLCQQAQIDPRTVDFSNPASPDTQRFVAAAQARAESRQTLLDSPHDMLPPGMQRSDVNAPQAAPIVPAVTVQAPDALLAELGKSLGNTATNVEVTETIKVATAPTALSAPGQGAGREV